ncbi:MAG: CBS domain-containing protein, partial [Rhodoplanes sp.]
MIQTPTERGRKPLKAADIMTREVIAVRPDTPTHSIAMLLLKHGISAAPVVDEGGALVGMVSE